MKGKLLDCPRHLAFSGTGSKILQILVSVREKGVLEEYTKLILKKCMARSMMKTDWIF